MTEKLNGVHGQSLFIDGFEVFRVVEEDGERRIALGAGFGTAIKYRDNPAELVADKAAIGKMIAALFNGGDEEHSDAPLH